MDDTLAHTITTAVTLWARETYQTEEIVVADASHQNADEAERLHRHFQPPFHSHY
jgi:hypothetical protein